VAFSSTDLGNDWPRLIEPARDVAVTPSLPQKLTDAEIWLGRAALLDSIYYTPEAL